MKTKVFQKAICLILSVTTLLGALGITSFAAEGKKEPQTNAGSAATLEDMVALLGTSTYSEYSENHSNSKWDKQLSEITIDVVDKLDPSSDAYRTDLSEDCNNSFDANKETWAQFGEENWEETVYLPTTNADGSKAASAIWHFNITEEQTGLYYLQIEYYNCQITNSLYNKSSVSAIERKLKIDGKVPFSEASSLTFDKHWAYDNISVVTTDADPSEKEGTYVEYEDGTKKNHKKDGYYKYVTVIKDGKKTVTTYKLDQDINGNSMTPNIKEMSVWSTYICKDTTGYYDGYFTFLFDEDKEYTITLEAEREPMIVKSIKLVPATRSSATIPTYEEYLKQYEGKSNATGKITYIQAEFPDFVSDSSVAPANNNSSAANYPISSSAQLFNVIGETGYSSVGQWAAYKFTVNESGMYNLAMRYKQETLQGMFACRTIKLAGGDYGLADGSPTVPFVEAQRARFMYDKEWQSENIGFYTEDANGNATKQDFTFYFEKGVEYTLYVECSLGDLKSYIERAETSLNNINECYLKILQRTGSDPDENTDYKFKETMPEVLVTLLNEAIELTAISDELERLCGTTGSHIATLDTIARILDIMGSNNGYDIPANMANLKTYLGTLGTWINDSKKGVVMIDSIGIVPADTDEDLPRGKAGFFKSLWFEISSFIYSFFTKYDQMGLRVEPTADSETVSVWLATGRDQSNIWRSMVDAEDGFTNKYNTAVTLKLVTAGTLLPSILSGNGPDVYMGLAASDVINYAIRSAVVGVSGNDYKNLSEDENIVFRSTVYENAEGDKVFVEKVSDTKTTYRRFTSKGYSVMSESEISAFKADLASYDVVSSPYSEIKDNYVFAANNALTLLDVSYGLPMTMGFAMMFYRMDVLGQLGLEVPESWDELLAMLPVLQTKNMSIGVSYISALDFMMYQMGGNMWKYADGSIYNPLYAGSKIDLDSEIAIEAFEFICRLYTDYSFPVSYDAANRFRTGEMPIVIGDYASIYNTLVVYATEIDGLWEFCPLPGSENEFEEDGFNYNSLATVSATVILNGCDDLLTAWQFAQWQTGKEAQAEYGNRIVAVIGPAAKYETANIEAVNDLSWTAREKAAIKDQMANLDSIVNYPGSYIYSRYMKFAFLDAYNDGVEPYEAMMSYIPAINMEIARKREEFDLPVAESAEEALLEVKGNKSK